MISDTPKTDALFFPYGRDATAAAEPSLLVCMTQYELLEREIAASRKELKECSSAFDRQQQQLDRNAEQNAALWKDAERLKNDVELANSRIAEMTRYFYEKYNQNAAQLDELHRISEALGTNEGHSSVTHIEILKEENAALREQIKQVEAGYATRNDEVTGLLGMNAELREQLAAAIDAAKEEGK